jgi:hypothetical protein
VYFPHAAPIRWRAIVPAGLFPPNPEIMKEFPANRPRRFQLRDWRRMTPATSLCAAVLLGLGGWAHFSGRQSDEAPVPDGTTANPVLPLEEFAVSTIQHEIDDPSGGRVMTASATASGGVRGHAEDEGDPNFELESASQSSDDRLRLAILGKWEDEYRGKRRLTVRDDGTGTMVVEPDGIGKRLFAAELRFELEWSLEEGHVTMKMIRGEPKSKVQLILKLHGQEADYKILDLTSDQMLLLDPDGKTRYDWRRPGVTADRTR